MIYYAIQNSDGHYWSGDKMVNPPIPVFTEDVKQAIVKRDRKHMENALARFAKDSAHGSEIVPLDSADHKHLAP